MELIITGLSTAAWFRLEKVLRGLPYREEYTPFTETWDVLITLTHGALFFAADEKDLIVWRQFDGALTYRRIRSNEFRQIVVK